MERKKEECVEDGMGCDDENGWKGKKFRYRGWRRRNTEVENKWQNVVFLVFQRSCSENCLCMYREYRRE
jgi:hypothetical protein